MKHYKIPILIAIFLIILSMGITIGLVINDLPYIRINKDVRFFEPMSFFLTALIGLFLPFYIKKWIDDRRSVRNELIDELKETLCEISKIRDKIGSCHARKSITREDKQEISFLFNIADLKVSNLEQLIGNELNSQISQLKANIKDEHIKYWKFLTSPDIMADSFTLVSDSYYISQNEIYSKIEVAIKKTINKIHQL